MSPSAAVMSSSPVPGPLLIVAAFQSADCCCNVSLTFGHVFCGEEAWLDRRVLTMSPTLPVEHHPADERHCNLVEVGLIALRIEEVHLSYTADRLEFFAGRSLGFPFPVATVVELPLPQVSLVPLQM